MNALRDRLAEIASCGAPARKNRVFLGIKKPRIAFVDFGRRWFLPIHYAEQRELFGSAVTCQNAVCKTRRRT
jgi:hypothetical protein